MKKTILKAAAYILSEVARVSLIPPSKLNCYEPPVPAPLKEKNS